MSSSLPRKSLSQLFSWLFFAFIIIAASQFLVAVIVVKFCAPELVGRLALSNAILTPIFAFSNLDLGALQITDTKNQYEFEDYLNLRFVTSGIAFLLSIIIPILAGYSLDTLIIVWLGAVLKTLDAVSSIAYGLMQKNEQMKTLAYLGIGKSLLSITLMGISIYLTGNLLLALMLLILFHILYLFFYEFPYSLATVNSSHLSGSNRLFSPSTQIDWSKVFTAKWYPRKLLNLAKLALPMGIVTLLINFNANIPRYLIEKYNGETSLGIFAAIASLMAIGDTVLNPLGTSATPRMAQYYAEGNLKLLWKILSKLVAIAIIIGVIIMGACLLIGQPFLEIVYRKEYGHYTLLLTLLMLAGSIEDISSFLGRAITATRSFRIKMFVSATVVTISAVISLWLIPSQGLLGAAIAILSGSIIDVGLNIVAIIYIMTKRRKNKLLLT